MCARHIGWGLRRTGTYRSLLLGEKPAIRFRDAFFEANASAPAQASEPRNIQQFLRRAIGLGCIEYQPSIETGHAANQLGQLANGDVGAHAHVDDVWIVI